MNVSAFRCGVAALTATAVTLVACTEKFPLTEECGNNNDCYIKHAIDTMNVMNNNIVLWENINTYTIIMVGIAGIVATIMIALQGDENRYWTRPIGIIATSLVTGITALVTSFHIPETKDLYINTYLKMITLNNQFEHDALRTTDPLAADELRFAFASEFSRLKADLLKTKGSLALISQTNQPPASPSAAASPNNQPPASSPTADPNGPKHP